MPVALAASSGLLVISASAWSFATARYSASVIVLQSWSRAICHAVRRETRWRDAHLRPYAARRSSGLPAR